MDKNIEIEIIEQVIENCNYGNYPALDDDEDFADDFSRTLSVIRALVIELHKTNKIVKRLLENEE